MGYELIYGSVLEVHETLKVGTKPLKWDTLKVGYETLKVGFLSRW